MELERLKELRNFFAGVPEEKINMSFWVYQKNHDGKNEEYSCMTAGCLAGWAGVYKPFVEQGFKAYQWGIEYSKEDGAFWQNYQAIAEFFGLEFVDALYLCSPLLYPETTIKKADVLARLDAIIAKGSAK